jgi:hypothetical protein
MHDLRIQPVEIREPSKKVFIWLSRPTTVLQDHLDLQAELSKGEVPVANDSLELNGTIISGKAKISCLDQSYSLTRDSFGSVATAFSTSTLRLIWRSSSAEALPGKDISCSSMISPCLWGLFTRFTACLHFSERFHDCCPCGCRIHSYLRHHWDNPVCDQLAVASAHQGPRRYCSDIPPPPRRISSRSPAWSRPCTAYRPAIAAMFRRYHLTVAIPA